MKAPTIDYYLQLCEQKKTSLEKNEWLNQLQQQGIDALKTHGFPGIKEENWKYTRVAPILQPAYQFPKACEQIITSSDIQAYVMTEGPLLVFVDGTYRADLSRQETNVDTIRSLTDAIESDNPLVKEHLGCCANIERPGLASLNTALMEEGAFIHLSEKTHLPHPIQILSINAWQPLDAINTLRHLILLDQHASACIIETYVSLDTKTTYFNNIVNETVLSDHAKLHYVKVQAQAHNSFHIHSLFSKQHAHSMFTSHNIDLGSKLTRNWLQTDLTAPHSECHLNGLYLAKATQHIDNHTRIEHHASSTLSRENYKGIANDDAKAIFNGQVVIQKGLEDCDAEQQNPNLVLSQTAEIDTKPQLEIFSNDVKCAHGATIGQLDEVALFYLKTRGLTEVEAKNILIYGFAYDLISQIEDKPTHNHLQNALIHWLPEGSTIDTNIQTFNNKVSDET